MKINPEVNKPIIFGKVKTVYQGIEDEEVLIHYHDKVTAGNGIKEENFKGKGRGRNQHTLHSVCWKGNDAM